ncbi:MAG: hypothetical protein HYY06_19755 [Deltaproteobacteria bacterium]|nr:hypothetical protein [Deltaproteobacteria bacterium]
MTRWPAVLGPSENEERILWVAWEIQRRNQSVAKRLGARLLEIHGVGTSRLGRYVRSTYETVAMALRFRPDAIIAANPSVVLATVAVLLGRALRRPVLLDTHNAGIEPVVGGIVADALATLLARGADVTVIHNDDLVESVRKRGGRPFVLPDPVPDLPAAAPSEIGTFKGRCNVFYICTYDVDEPYLEVMEAGRLLPPDVHIYVSGRRSELLTRANPPANVIPTGYLSEADYVRALRAADVVMALTTLDRCALCGAYEAVSAGKPMVLTGTSTLRHIFSRGAVFTENDARRIAGAIDEALRRKSELSSEAIALRTDLEARWGERLSGLQELLRELSRSSRED